jgi:hypothetical protein
MKPRYFSLLVFVIIMIGGKNAFTHILEQPTAPVKPEFSEPHEVIGTYLNAVNRGELIVLDRKIEKSMLIPIRVEYVYELDSAIPRIKVYSKLKQPIPVPGQENCNIKGVSAILDINGSIIETEAHIWLE